MSNCVTFEGHKDPLTLGRSTCSILRLPEPAVQGLDKRSRIEGDIAKHPVNLALFRAPVGAEVFLWTGQSLLDRIGIRPGGPVEVRLRPARNASNTLSRI